MSTVAVFPFKGERLKSAGDRYPDSHSERIRNTSERLRDMEGDVVYPLKVAFTTRVSQIAEALSKELGGDLTIREELLVRSVANFSAQLEQFAEQWLYKDVTDQGISQYEAAMSRITAALEMLEKLGGRKIGKRPHPLGDNPASVHRK